MGYCGGCENARENAPALGFLTGSGLARHASQRHRGKSSNPPGSEPSLVRRRYDSGRRGSGGAGGRARAGAKPVLLGAKPVHTKRCPARPMVGAVDEEWVLVRAARVPQSAE